MIGHHPIGVPGRGYYLCAREHTVPLGAHEIERQFGPLPAGRLQIDLNRVVAEKPGVVALAGGYVAGEALVRFEREVDVLVVPAYPGGGLLPGQFAGQVGESRQARRFGPFVFLDFTIEVWWL